MKFTFPENDPNQIKDKIMAELGGRELGKIVNFGVEPNTMTVTISKLGTSTLKFAQEPKDGGLEFSLAQEKIALSHRAFKDEVKNKIRKVIEKVGGTVIEG